MQTSRRSLRDFPAFGWGLSLRSGANGPGNGAGGRFPRLRVGTFIEAESTSFRLSPPLDFPTFGWGLSLRPMQSLLLWLMRTYFPTFGWGLSLRLSTNSKSTNARSRFPHLRVGTFIEAHHLTVSNGGEPAFPHLRVGTFIEAMQAPPQLSARRNFPTFGWGLSLR